MGTRNYAPNPQAAREFQDCLRAYLTCPHCGVTEQLMAQMLSQTGVVMKCLGCRLRYHCRREDLAKSARNKAAKATDRRERALLERVAAIFEPHTNPRHTYAAQPPADVDVDA